MDKYVALIRGQVQSNLQIPPQLLALQESGDCTLEFTLAPNGHLVAVKVLRSSGISLVDQTALQALQNSNIPAFLAGMPRETHRFSLTIHVGTD